jgi:hypothetical protein
MRVRPRRGLRGSGWAASPPGRWARPLMRQRFRLCSQPCGARIWPADEVGGGPGSRTYTDVPPPGRSSTQAVPPCNSARRRTNVSPIAGLGEWIKLFPLGPKGWKTDVRNSLGRPGPASSTASRMPVPWRPVLTPGPRRSCVVSVSSEGDPEGPSGRSQARPAGREQLPTRPCRRRDRPGVHRLVAERRTWAPGPPVEDQGGQPPGRGARAGGLRRLSGRS